MKQIVNNQQLKSGLRVAKIIVSITLIVVILRYSGFLNGASVSDESAVEKNFDYNFELKDISGKVVNVQDFKDKVIFLNMWATWCGPCRSEMPSIQSLYNKVDKDKVIFIMLSLDTEENQQKVVKYVGDKSFTFPVYQPVDGLPKQLQISTIPTTFIIGKDGKIKEKKVGMENYDTEEYVSLLASLATTP
jgi:thiol-disulfide isomerase/thioredoxin